MAMKEFVISEAQVETAVLGRDCGAGGTHYEDAGRAEDE